jgi:hypothetical protein
VILTESKYLIVVSTTHQGFDLKDYREVPVSIPTRFPSPQTLVELPYGQNAKHAIHAAEEDNAMLVYDW